MKNIDTLYVKMRKNPSLFKHFSSIKNNTINEKISFSLIISIFEKYKKYQNLFKNKNINPLTFDSFEKLDDTLTFAIKENSNKNFIKKFISKKYEFLINDKNVDLFHTLNELNINHDLISNHIKKIALFKNPDELYDTLKLILTSNDSFNLQNILHKISLEKEKIDILYNENNILIINIPNFSASKNLGVNHWCISRSPSFFNIYINKSIAYKKKANQYFYYNFNLPINDRLSMVGVTLSYKDFIFAADRFDNSLKKDHPICKKIISEHLNYLSDDVFFNNFIDVTLGTDYKSLEFFFNSISKLNLSKIKEESIFNVSSFFDKFSSKGINKKKYNIFEYIIFKYLDKNNEISPEILSLLEIKYPKILTKLKHNNYKFNYDIIKKYKKEE